MKRIGEEALGLGYNKVRAITNLPCYLYTKSLQSKVIMVIQPIKWLHVSGYKRGGKLLIAHIFCIMR